MFSVTKPPRALSRLAVSSFALWLALLPRPASADFGFCETPVNVGIVMTALTAAEAAVMDVSFGVPSGLLMNLISGQVASATQRIVGGDRGLNAIDEAGLENYKPPNPCVPVKLNLLSLKIGGNVCLYDVRVIGDYLANSIQMAKARSYFGGLGYMDITMRWRLDKFWRELHEGLKAMTAQIYASGLNNARLLASLSDAGNLSGAGGAVQDAQIDAKLQFQISDETCRYESMAGSLSTASAISNAFSSALSLELNDIGNQTVGSPGAGGGADFQKWRFDFYRDNLCDPQSDIGRGVCGADATSEGKGDKLAQASLVGDAQAADSAEQPSAPKAAVTVQSLFASPTIDIKNPETARAIQELAMNVVHYAPPTETIGKGGAIEVEKLFNDRRYVAQMDAVSSLVWKVIEDLTPGEKSESVQQLRQRSGAADASVAPSEYEILQTAVSRLGDPQYYASLDTGGGTGLQNEVQLMAYNVMVLGKILDYQERIGVAEMVEAANMLAAFKDTGGAR